MKDEVLNKALPGDATAVPRFALIAENGATLYNNVQLNLLNEVAQAGTPYDRASVLPDSVATAMDLADTATPADAFAILAKLYPMFYLGVAPGTRALRMGHSNEGAYAYYAIRNASLQTQVVVASDETASGMQIFDEAGQRKAMLNYDNVADSAQLNLDDSQGYGFQIGTSWSVDRTNTYRGIWLRGANGSGIMAHFGHTIQTGKTYQWFKYGTSAVYQIYLETLATGPKITLRQPNGNVGLELYADDTNGGTIKLYNASGVLRQTI